MVKNIVVPAIFIFILGALTLREMTPNPEAVTVQVTRAQRIDGGMAALAEMHEQDKITEGTLSTLRQALDTLEARAVVTAALVPSPAADAASAERAPAK